MPSPTSSEWDGRPLHIDGRASYQLQTDLDFMRELARGADWLVEVGAGEAGTSTYVSMGLGCRVLLVDLAGDVDVQGDAADPEILVKAAALTDGEVMVVLDADVYDRAHVHAELQLWSALVTQGQHLVVCKTHRETWGALPALRDWDPEANGFRYVTGPEPTLNTYLQRILP
jgi:Cephalosporin hydroxylase